MAQKNTETDEDMPIEEAKAIKPDFTGLPIEIHIRRHFQFIVILSICLFLGYIVFGLTLLAWVTTVRWAENEGHLAKYNLDLVWGRSFMMWRTDWGKDFIENLSQYRTFWKRVGDVWVITVFAIMVFMFLLLLWQATLAWQIPKSASVSPKMMIGLPGLNPVIPLWYGILALAIAMVIHEFSHGILSRVADVKVKALGLLLFVFPVGAFVEPDEEGMKSMKKWERMRLYAAGPGSNMVVAIICSLMFSWVMVASLEPSNEGVLSASVVVDYGGEEAGLEPWMLITAVNDQEITSAEDFSNALNETYVGQVVNVSVLDKGNPDTYQVTLSDKGSYYLKYYPDSYEPWMSGKGFMGIAVVDPDAITENLAHPANSGGSMLQYITLPFQDLQPFPEHFTALFEPTGIVGILPDNIFWILANCFYWIFWLNLMVGLTNALPAVPLDGGFIFADGVTGILDKVRTGWSEEKKEAIVDNLVGILAFSVLFLVFWQLIGPKLVGVDPVILDANINASGNEGFNGDMFTFDASGSEGTFVSYEWEFGDGSSDTGESVSYNWSEGGVYFVILTAKDAEDRQSVEFYQMTIDYTGEGSGEVGGGQTDTVAATVNPYINEVNIYMNITGDSDISIGNTGASSDVTVTIELDKQVIFSESYNINKGNTEAIQFSLDSGEMVGDWEIILEANDATSDFTYEYDWFNDFQISN